MDPLELPDPPARAAWLQYRYDTISEMVRLLAEEVHARKKLVTTAVFPTPAIARHLVRQNWVSWPVDAVLPMVYHAFYKEEVACSAQGAVDIHMPERWGDVQFSGIQ